MRNIYLIFISFLYTSLKIYGQDFQDAQWFIGVSSSKADHIDFRMNSIEPLSEIVGIGMDGGSAISREYGNLVLYSNGCEVRNHFYEQIENGDSLNPGALQIGFCGTGSSTPLTQSVLALQKPGSNDQFILLILDLDRPYWTDTTFLSIAPTKLYINTIDISLNEGRGEVINKNYIAIQDTFSRGYLTAVKHANGRDWFIIVPKSHSNCYFIMILSDDGIVPVDTICTGKVWGDIENIGQATFSPDGHFYVRTHGAQGLHLFNFDRCSGDLNYAQELNISPDTVTGAGAAFSRDSRFLYASKDLQLFQFDLHANDINESKVLVGQWTSNLPSYVKNFYQLQLGLDGKIYIGSTGNFGSMHVIHEPNKKGDSCYLEMGGIKLSGQGYFDIPLFPNFRLGPIDSSFCDTLGIDYDPVSYFTFESMINNLNVQFSNLAYGNIISYLWNFGDGQTSIDFEPEHFYQGTGQYEVCLTSSNGMKEHIFCRTLIIEMTSQMNGFPCGEIKFIPNPSNDHFTIGGNQFCAYPIKVEIYSVTGVLMSRVTLEVNNPDINVNNFPSGIYFVVISNNEGLIGQEKIIINH